MTTGVKPIDQRKVRRQEYMVTRGSTCTICKKMFPPVILQLHHPDPSVKETGFKWDKWTAKGYEKVKAEADTCVVICPTCHQLEHYMLRQGQSLLESK